jgi:hypothetical protein
LNNVVSLVKHGVYNYETRNAEFFIFWIFNANCVSGFQKFCCSKCVPIGTLQCEEIPNLGAASFTISILFEGYKKCHNIDFGAMNGLI